MPADIEWTNSTLVSRSHLKNSDFRSEMTEFSGINVIYITISRFTAKISDHQCLGPVCSSDEAGCVARIA
jgi:hypothetical protein